MSASIDGGAVATDTAGVPVAVTPLAFRGHWHDSPDSTSWVVGCVLVCVLANTSRRLNLLTSMDVHRVPVYRDRLGLITIFGFLPFIFTVSVFIISSVP